MTMKSIGIYNDKSIIHLAELDSKKNIVDVLSLDLNTENPNYKDNVKRLYIWMEKNKGMHIIGLCPNKCLLKSLKINIKSKRALLKALNYQIKSLTALNEKDNVFYPIIKDKDVDGFNILCWIANKLNINNIIKKYKLLNIYPDVISSNAMALSRFFKHYVNDSSPSLVIYLSSNETTCVILENNFPVSAYVIDIGKNKINLSYQKKSQKNDNDINFLKINEKKFDKLNETLTLWHTQLIKFLMSYNNDLTKEKLKVLFTGHFDEYQNLDSFLLNNSEEYLSEKILNTNLSDKAKYYAISIGLALDSIYADHLSVQFRQNELIPKKHFSKLLLTFSSVFIISLLFSFLIFFSVDKKIKKKESFVLENYKSIESLENIYIPSKEKSLINSDRGISQKLVDLEKIIKKEAKNFYFYPIENNVSKTINWIDSIINDSSQIEILLIDYKLLDYPTINEKKPTYNIKIVVEFTASDNSYAKAFFNRLKDHPSLSKKDISTLEETKQAFKANIYINEGAVK